MTDDPGLALTHLTTHVLDTARGVPAEGVAIEVHQLSGGERRRVATVRTQADGRTTLPLIGGTEGVPGVYELTFHVGAYFRRAGFSLPEPPFLDEIVIRVGLADALRPYHVPLLVSPYGYSTYRGS
jgi:5-hydroxyisourate hydrolase